MNDEDNDVGYPSRLTPLQKEHWNAARILYMNNIPACLVGPPASAFYGSDDLWIRVLIIVNDPAFEDACQILCANAYERALMSDDERMLLQPPYPYPEGKEPLQWRLFSPVGRNSFSVILAPASHWHFEISENTAIAVDGFPLPKYVAYLQALISVLAHRCKFSIPPGYFVSQTLNVLVLRDNYPNAMKQLSPADEFILEHYFSVRKSRNRMKVVELWEDLKNGILTVEEALAVVPTEKFPDARQQSGSTDNV